MCRSGCATQDHSSYGECLRAAGVRVAYCGSVNGLDATKQRRWDKELERYRSLKARGVQPAGTTTLHLDRAERSSDAAGVAYRAD